VGVVEVAVEQVLDVGVVAVDTLMLVSTLSVDSHSSSVAVVTRVLEADTEVVLLERDERKTQAEAATGSVREEDVAVVTTKHSRMGGGLSSLWIRRE